MDRLRRSFRDSFRKRKDRVPESSKPHQWQEDESAVRQGACAFAVKYLGCVEVFESRGMQVCEEALKVLRGSRRRPIRAMLHVSGDGLRVVEDETKGLIVDQTIEKVSFCAPDRNHERGFSYICRDGTTRRWMCHGFLALRESGERLSHAVGCAFAVCLEKKQKRDKECGVSMTFDAKTSTFTRSGSFRQQSITEKMDNSAPVVSNAPVVNPFAIERPHATPSMLERQNSFRGFGNLQNSPFKRQMSLRVNDLPSNAERLNLYKISRDAANSKVSPIPEVVPQDSVTALCQQLSQGLSQLTQNDDIFSNTNNISVTATNTISLDLTSTPLTTNNQITPVNLANQITQHSPDIASLPKPDQWLGKITNNATPSPGNNITNPTRKYLSSHSRAISLDSSEMFPKPDPFDAEWAANVTGDTSASTVTPAPTNPFLAPNQTFQIQL